MRSGYPDVNWFLRATRVAPVIAGAALVGGMIGGFAIFAVDSALGTGFAAAADARADTTASVVDQHATRPVRIVGGAIPDPSAGMSGPPPRAAAQFGSCASTSFTATVDRETARAGVTAATANCNNASRHHPTAAADALARCAVARASERGKCDRRA
jgi:hypothetical protein